MIGDPLRELSPLVRVLAAVVDAFLAYGTWTDAAVAMVETAELRESPEAEAWRRSRLQRFMAVNGWRTIEDVYEQAGIPKDRQPALSLDALGFEDREIAVYLDTPLRTIQLWLHDERPKLKRVIASAIG
jgi:DNA-directed RNA polymerase specialized sigma24 family protein